MKSIATLIIAISISHVAFAAEPRCALEAAEQAKRLLIHHLGAVGEELKDQMGFEAPSPKPPMTNPANPKQKFSVLEVVGYVQPRGEYRMRFIYFLVPRGCLLVGEEILELASL